MTAATQLEVIIKSWIAANGPMDMGAFMNYALGHPEHGYYMKQDPFGASGDFTTAPEISQMFGEMIGAWAADAWHKIGAPPGFILLECGPGRGTLMADILRAARHVPGFHEAAQIHLLEMSPVLRELQKTALSAFKVEWHETLASVLQDIPIIIIANEFMDALPIRQLQKHGGQWHERVLRLDLENNNLVIGLAPASPALVSDIPHQIANEAEGTIFEVAPARAAFMMNMCGHIKKSSGAALIIDYGHARRGAGDTLQALYKHQFTDVLSYIGDADITAHVDFGALSNIAVKSGVSVYGPVSQAHFLKSVGIDIRAAALQKNADMKQKKDIESALHRLTDSSQMGGLFKVMGVASHADIKLSGF